MVIIVNRTLAERYWPGQDPIGKRIHIGVKDTPLPWMTVVGEIGDIKQGTADTDTRPQIYQPASQWKRAIGMFAPPEMLTGNYGSIVLRSALPPENMTDALRSAVRSIDPQLPLIQIESMDRVVAEGQAPRRFNAALISSFRRSRRVAGGARHLQRDCILRRTAHARDGHPPGPRLAAFQRRGPHSCLGRKARPGRMRDWRHRGDLRHQAFAVAVCSRLIRLIQSCWCWRRSPSLLWHLLASMIPARRAAAVEPMQALRMD